MTALSNYLENKLIDQLVRGTAYSFPSQTYAALMTSPPSDQSPGTEVSGGSYARVAVPSTLDEWAGTQGAGSTAVSTGTSGTTSNNKAITYPAPTSNWGTVTHVALFDSQSGGNMLIWGALTMPKTINNGDSSPSFQPAALVFQIDA